MPSRWWQRTLSRFAGLADDEYMETTGRTIRFLSEIDCWSILPEKGVGRVGICIDGRPFIFPVNYATWGRSIVFRTGPGAKLGSAIDKAPAAFEIDSTDIIYHEGWSILATGSMREVKDEEQLDAIAHLPLAPWAPGDKSHFVRIEIEEITGREIL